MDDEILRRMMRSEMQSMPASRAECSSPEALQATATSPGDGPAQRAVLEHVATCAPCRRDFDLLRTAHAAAPEAARVTRPRWIPALAAAAVIVVVSLVAIREPDDTVRGGEPGTVSAVELLQPERAGTGLALRWRAVPEAVTYRVEVTDDEGNVAFSTQTSDTTVISSALGTVAPGGTTLRWSVEARLLDGAVRTSRLDTLTPPR